MSRTMRDNSGDAPSTPPIVVPKASIPPPQNPPVVVPKWSQPSSPPPTTTIPTTDPPKPDTTVSETNQQLVTEQFDPQVDQWKSMGKLLAMMGQFLGYMKENDPDTKGMSDAAKAARGQQLGRYELDSINSDGSVVMMGNKFTWQDLDKL